MQIANQNLQTANQNQFWLPVPANYFTSHEWKMESIEDPHIKIRRFTEEVSITHGRPFQGVASSPLERTRQTCPHSQCHKWT